MSSLWEAKLRGTAAFAAGLFCLVYRWTPHAATFASLSTGQRVIQTPAHQLQHAEAVFAKPVSAQSSAFPQYTCGLAMLSSAAVATGLAARRRKSYRATSRSTPNVAMLAGKGSVETFLIEGDVDAAKLAMKCAGIAGYMDLSTVVFFSLGISEELISSVAGGALGLHGACPVFIVDCYGIIGWDEGLGKNIELMEEGRGKEYGGVGGNGGKGIVVAAFRGPAFTTSVGEEQVSQPGESHMLICNGDAKYQQAKSGAIYGGMAKKCFVMDSSTGSLQEISSFAVSGTVASAVSTFSGDAANAAETISKTMPNEAKEVKAAGYFPCYMKGVNKYGRDGVEPTEFAVAGLKNTKLFGMFAHGELGPPEGTVVVGGPEVGGSIDEVSVSKHSMVSVLALLQER